ncbi:MAG TPA: hypothetical protein VF452_03395 [Candidatus Binatia bacterium]
MSRTASSLEVTVRTEYVRLEKDLAPSASRMTPVGEAVFDTAALRAAYSG